MLPIQRVPSDVYILPETIGASVRATAETLAQRGEMVEPEVLLYAEKPGGFQCGTCHYATAVNATHGKCKILKGTIHLTEGCCAAWEPNKLKLHLYREIRNE